MCAKPYMASAYSPCMGNSTLDTAIGVTLIVIGAASLFGWLDLGWIVTVAAVIALVVGILILVGKFSGSTLFGIILVVAGVLLLFPNWLGGVVGNIITTIAAVILIVIGVMKLMGRW